MRRILLPALYFALVLAFWLTPVRRAEAIEDLVSPRSLGVANSFIGDATGALGPQLNPAGMVLRRGYNIELLFGFNIQSLGPSVNVSIVDSVTSKVAAGVYYSFVYSTPKIHYLPNGPGSVVPQLQPLIKREGHEAGLSIGLPLGDKFALGLTAKYITVDTNITSFDAGASMLPTPISIDSTSGSNSVARGFTFDVGLSLRLGDKFQVGLVGRNLIPLRSIEAPMLMGLGLAYKPTNLFTIALDTTIKFNQYCNQNPPFDQPSACQGETTARLGGGIEWLIIGKVPLRLGYLWDSGPQAPGGHGLSQHYFSAGLGYQGQKFSVDVSYRQQVAFGTESLLAAGIRVFLE